MDDERPVSTFHPVFSETFFSARLFSQREYPLVPRSAPLTSPTSYLKTIDSFQNNHIHTLITGGNVKFMLLMNPDPASTAYASYQVVQGSSRPGSTAARPHSTARQSTLIANNPHSQGTEDAVRAFMNEVSALPCTES